MGDTEQDLTANEQETELDDPGGVPFDDDFEIPEPPSPDEGSRGEGPAYDYGSSLQARGIGYPSSTPVGMTALKTFVLSRWSGADLGCLSIPPRAMRGGASPSLHNWGMAWDWRWANPGPGREAADDVIAFCEDNAIALGIQGVHDYEKCRYWKSYAGWQTATNSASSGFGQSWAQWLHIERTWAAANDGRSIETALREGGRKLPGPIREPRKAPQKMKLPEPVIKEGNKGANVARLQDFLRHFRFADFKRSDGEFGPRTKGAVENAQRDFQQRGTYDASVDGEYGPKSHVAATMYLDDAKDR